MKAVITVIGTDTVGIMATVSGICAAHQANIVDVTQTVLQDLFAMVMLVTIDQLREGLAPLREELQTVATTRGLQIHVMHEDIFHSMHRI